MKQEKSSDFWDELTSDQKKEIETAKNEIKEGNYSVYYIFMSNIGN